MRNYSNKSANDNTPIVMISFKNFVMRAPSSKMFRKYIIKLLDFTNNQLMYTVHLIADGVLCIMCNV